MANTGTVVVRILGDSKGLNAALAESDAKVGGFGQKLSGLGTLAVASAAVVAGAFVGAGVGLFKVGESFDEAYDKIRVGTGATGDQLAALQQDFKNVVSTVPTDFGKASDAIVAVKDKLGATGPSLDSISEQFLELSRITDTDLKTNLQAGTDALNNWGVTAERQPAVLDELFRASQNSGVAFSDLASQLTDAGPVLRALGFGVDDAAALIATLGKAGVDTSDVMPALSKTLATAAKEGKSAGDVFRETFDKIKAAPTDTEAAGDALQVFGAKAGPKMAELIREGKLSYEDMVAAIQGGGDTILGAGEDTQDFSEKWELFKNKVLVALEPIAIRVFGAIGDAMDKLGPIAADAIGAVVEQVDMFVKALTTGDVGSGTTIEKFAVAIRETVIPAVEKLVDFFTNQVLPVAQEVAEWIGDNFTPILVTLGGVLGALTVSALVSGLVALVGAIASPVVAIGALVAALVYAYNNFEGFRTVVDAVASFLVNDVAPAIAEFVGFLVAQVQHLAEWWSEHWAAIQEAVDHVLTVVSAIINAFIVVVQTIWEQFGDTILTYIKGVWDEIMAVVQFAVTFIQSIIEFVLAVINGDWGDAWQAIVDMNAAFLDLIWTTIKNAFDFIVTFIGDALETIVAYFGGLPGSIAGALSGFASTLYNKGVEAMSALWTAITDVAGNIIGWFAGLPGWILGAIGDLGRLLYDKGRQLINGLKDGIVDAAKAIPGAIADAVGGGIGGIVSGAIGAIPGIATGSSYTSGGLALVGEQGPERVILPQGAQVFPSIARESRRAATGGGVTFEGPNNFYGADAAEIADEMDWLVRTGSLKGAA